MKQPSGGPSTWRFGLIGCAFWVLWSGAAGGSAPDQSLLIEVEEVALEPSPSARSVQVGIFLTYRGPEPADWAVLNLTLSYRDGGSLLERPPYIRLSEFDSGEPGLTPVPIIQASRSGAGTDDDPLRLVNSRSDSGSGLAFACGKKASLVSESVNPSTSRIEAQAVGNPVLFSTIPNKRLLVAILTLPVRAGRSGMLELSFVSDSLIQDGNALIDVQGNRLSAYLLDGALSISPPPALLGIPGSALVVAILLAAILVLQRFPKARPAGGRWIVGAVAAAIGIGFGIFLVRSHTGDPGEAGPVIESASERTGLHGPASRFQFASGKVHIPGAHRYEARLGEFNLQAASKYLEAGFDAWNTRYRCIGCHTSGMYLLVRPMLTAMGPPADSRRAEAIAALDRFPEERPELALTGHRAAQVVYVAAGLASWDRFVIGETSSETARALQLMFRLQEPDGGWPVPSCWPPLQSSRLQLGSVAALAVGLAPDSAIGPAGVVTKRERERLIRFLSTSKAELDYDRVWLLWADSRLENFLPARERQSIVELVLSRQRSDGGWSLRDFGTPGSWGDGIRQARLVAEPEFYLPSSDGHMTGLAVIALTEAGLPGDDGRILKAIRWIERNQRVTGRWWTSSLNSDSLHLITYSGTCFCLLSLSRSGALLRPEP